MVDLTYTTLPNSRDTLEKEKFGVDQDGKVSVRTLTKKANSVLAVQTTAGVTAVLLNTPEGCDKIKVKHISSGEIIYIGDNVNITASTADVYPLKADEIIDLNINKNQDNEIYIVSDGTAVIVYAIGEVNV